ncbi:MAG: hypothetical protein DMD92_20390 [Candidatus Rokuibacteriota bacterium]|nr:MAG: hypothetical protein DMD92_20390 [Candidatus Rokubacteria bacterium]
MRVAMFPAVSRAVTVRRLAPVWRTMPLAVQLVVPVAVPLPPRVFAQVTCVTPTLSDAVPPSARDDVGVLYVEPAVGVVIATVGSEASNVTVMLAVLVFPTASFAVTVSTLAPDCSTIPLAVQLVVPVAVPLPPRLFAQVTCVTPTLSDAVPPSARDDVGVLYVEPEVGVVIAIVGSVVSPPAPVPVTRRVLISPPAAKLTLTEAVADVVGVKRTVTAWVAPSPTRFNVPPETMLKGAEVDTVPDTVPPTVFDTVKT